MMLYTACNIRDLFLFNPYKRASNFMSFLGKHHRKQKVLARHIHQDHNLTKCAWFMLYFAFSFRELFLFNPYKGASNFMSFLVKHHRKQKVLARHIHQDHNLTKCAWFMLYFAFSFRELLLVNPCKGASNFMSFLVKHHRKQKALARHIHQDHNLTKCAWFMLYTAFTCIGLFLFNPCTFLFWLRDKTKRCQRAHNWKASSGQN